MKMWIDAYRRAPDTTRIKAPKKDKINSMSTGKRKVYDAYLSGLRKIKDIAELIKMSYSYVGTTLRQLSDQGLIKLHLTPVMLGRKERKAECLSLIVGGDCDMNNLAKVIDVSIGVIRKYAAELMCEKKVVYHAGIGATKYTLYAKEVA